MRSRPSTTDSGKTPRASKLEGWITAGLAALAVGAGSVAIWPKATPHQPLSLERPAIRVSVGGEVRKPGVYTLPFGSRAEAAIAAAGGLTNNAETSLVRPAEVLEDGEPVLVPSKYAKPVVSEEKPVGATERINLNNATLEQLETLPGVGPKFAARIVTGRPYSSLADLDAVKGVGPAMLKKLAPLVKF